MSPISYHALNLPVLERVPVGARRVLDLGCGTGNLGAAIKGRGTCEVIGVTFSHTEAEEARRRLDHVMVLDLEEFAPGEELGRFDVIVCSHILEHLRHPEELLKRLHGCLNPSGILVVALPNILHWKQRLKFLRGQFRYTAGGVMDSTHFRFFDWDTADELVKRAGYEVAERRADGNFPQPFLRRLVPGFAKRVDNLASHVAPGMFGHQFIIAARLQKSGL